MVVARRGKERKSEENSGGRRKHRKKDTYLFGEKREGEGGLCVVPHRTKKKWSQQQSRNIRQRKREKRDKRTELPAFSFRASREKKRR